MENRVTLGIIGLGVMGRSLAQNFHRHGFLPLGYDLDPDVPAPEGIPVVKSLDEFINRLPPPRLILLAIPAGAPIKAAIGSLLPFLQKGDLIIDAGNSHYKESEQRTRELAGHGIDFIGLGVSGGEKGALSGPSLMPGGSYSAWLRVKPMLEKISAKAADGLSCVAWMGPGGAGHFVKMVHNGIEYALMQLIAEIYDLLHRSAGQSNPRLAEIFASWNQGELGSYLVKSTTTILSTIDETTSQPLVDLILDTAEQKGTGKWASLSAFEIGAAVPTINAAVESRIISAFKDERAQAARIFGDQLDFSGEINELIDAAEHALYCGFIICFAQGLSLLKMASEAYNWQIDPTQVIRVWRAGCIIQAGLLNDIQNAFRRDPNLQNLLLDDFLSQAIIKYHTSWRFVLQTAVGVGIPMPALGSALAYFDAYRSQKLPTNLIQAQRDYFGAHKYWRVDRNGKFHTNWEVEMTTPGETRKEPK